MKKSCKDYDEDIEQINKELTDLKSQIAALQTAVNSGNYVTGVSKTADGKGMTFTFSNGSPITVALDVKDGAQGAAGKDAQQVTIDEKTGELLIDGKGTGIKPFKDGAKAPVKAEGGYWFFLNEDGEYEDTNIPVSGITVTGSELTGYTLTVYGTDGTKVVKLPTAASALNSVTIDETKTHYFTAVGVNHNTNGVGVNWGVAGKAIDWKGPKGTIAKDQLLVGQITKCADLRVSPATYDLAAQTLTLVASDGSVAPVDVYVSGQTVVNGALNTGSRAYTSTGLYSLAIKMNSTITADNIASAFTNSANGKNLKYALAVNGTIQTGYVFVVDTQTGTEAAKNDDDEYTIDLDKLSGFQYASSDAVEPTPGLLKTGDNYLSYSDGIVYDSYLSFTGTNIALAKKLGITVSGMKISVPAKVSGNAEGLEVTVNVVDVTGYVAESKNQELTFKTSTITSDAIAKTTYKVAAVAASRKNIVISLGDVLASMSEADVESVKNNATQLFVDVKGTGNSDKFIYNEDDVQYAKTLQSNGHVVDKAFDASTDDLRDLKYIVIPVSSIKENAEAGTYTLRLTIKDEVGNEIKKVEMPVEITLQTWGEVFTKSAAWSGDVASLQLNNSKEANFFTAYSFNAALKDGIDVEIDKINNKEVATYNAGTITINTNAVSNGAVTDVKAKAIFKFGGKMKINSGKHTVKFLAPLNGASLVYYKEGAAATATINGANGTIDKYVAAKDDVKAAGLAMVIKNVASAMTEVNKVDINAEGKYSCTFDALAGSAAAKIDDEGNIKIENLAAGVYTTKLTIAITDGNGIKTVVTMPINVNN